MTERYDAVIPRKGKDEKTYYTKIGVMWPLDRGGFRLVLNALPMPEEGQAVILMFEPREDDRKPAPAAPRSPASRSYAAAKGKGAEPLDDEIPFGPEVR